MRIKDKEIHNIFGSILVGIIALLIFVFMFLPYIESMFITKELLDEYKNIKNYSLSFISGIFVMIVFHIVSNTMKKEKELKESLNKKEKQLNLLTNIVDTNIISTVTDLKGNILEVTKSFLDTYEYSLEEILNKSHNIIRSNKVPTELYLDLWNNISNGSIWEGELLNITKNGKEIWINTTIFPEFDENINIIRYRSISHNITEQKKANYLLEFDSLTNLPNKSSFEKTLNHAITMANRNHSKLAVIFLDIDNFKDINEKYGYFGGDETLKIITKRLKSIIRKGDILSRYSGDEFVLLLENINELEVMNITSNISNAISKDLEMNDGHKLNLSLSIGMSIYPDNGDNVLNLIKNADSAMLHVKNHGKNSYKFFNDEISNLYKKRILIEHTLIKYLENKDFYVLYQPKYDLSTQKIIGAEALIRMKDNIYYPDEFISVAEETDKISEITKLVIEKVVQDLKTINYNNINNFNISINLSSKDLKDNTILDFILNETKKNNINKSLISIEITEYTLMKDINHSIKILKEFQNNGIEISLDDFGTGYSSMSYLKLLPINVIKIDKSFTNNIDKDIRDEHIVSAMINLTKSLKLDIIVEGIETISQENLLYKIGCEQGQGYLFSKPLSLEDFKIKLNSQIENI